MVGFIDAHRDEHGVEPICRQLEIAPSTYYAHKAQQADPTRRSDRARRDEQLAVEIERVFDNNYQVYGYRKVHQQLCRDGFSVARCTVQRLMRQLELQGAVRGRAWKTTTNVDRTAPPPPDLVDRNFVANAPNMLWVSDLTYVATWQGFVYVAFVIDAYARRIVGWRVSTSLCAELALDALEQAIHDRLDPDITSGELVHHSDRGVQYLAIRYTERLAEAGIEPSVGSVGDSYDNALAETVIGLFKTEVIRRRRALAAHRRRRVCRARMGRLVQPPAPLPAPGIHPTRRTRSQLLPSTQSSRNDRTQPNESPVTPVRFRWFASWAALERVRCAGIVLLSATDGEGARTYSGGIAGRPRIDAGATPRRP